MVLAVVLCDCVQSLRSRFMRASFLTFLQIDTEKPGVQKLKHLLRDLCVAVLWFTRAFAKEAVLVLGLGVKT